VVFAQQAGSQRPEQKREQPETLEASAQHLAPPQEARIQPPSPVEGPAASEADSFSSDPSSTQFRKG
jgi:hypothetical protein